MNSNCYLNLLRTNAFVFFFGVLISFGHLQAADSDGDGIIDAIDRNPDGKGWVIDLQETNSVITHTGSLIEEGAAVSTFLEEDIIGNHGLLRVYSAGRFDLSLVHRMIRSRKALKEPIFLKSIPQGAFYFRYW